MIDALDQKVDARHPAKVTLPSPFDEQFDSARIAEPIAGLVRCTELDAFDVVCVERVGRDQREVPMVRSISGPDAEYVVRRQASIRIVVRCGGGVISVRRAVPALREPVPDTERGCLRGRLRGGITVAVDDRAVA